MDSTRTVIWIVGVSLVVVAMFMLFFQTGLNRFIPAGIALAGLVLVIGVIVMSMADKMPRSHATTTHHDSNTQVTHEPPTREEHIIERGGHGGHH